MTEKTNIIKKIGESIAKDIREAQEASRYFRIGYLFDPPTDGQESRQRSTDDGDFILREKFCWNQDIKIWQVTNREWEQITPFPTETDKTGIIGDIVTRYNNWQEKKLVNGFINRQKFFAPPKAGEPISKSRSWQGCREFGYEYSWNQDRNMWDEVGRYRIATEGGTMH